ncbi:FAD-dependent oxidoreductase [Robertmurraya sp. FSL W8-0741]|uniref:FAD-dependent oxidoreductase n=1 Tax=Robertmurraya sp. FSL W8-0741 TaxID=2954629 RepID=UPI0030F8571E
MNFLKDSLSIFKKREIPFLEYYKESEDVYTFLFEKEKDLTWKAGQHGLFNITHKKIKNPTRPFTLVTTPSEDIVKITTKIDENPSEFKNALLELKQGMKVSMNGPVGGFYLKENNPSLLIAGGIGITPFRAMLKQIEEEGIGNQEPIQLLYLDSEKAFLFKDELDSIANNASITITYIDSRDNLYQEIERFSTLYNSKGKYLIAGPTSMIQSISTYLQNNGTPKRNIKKDVFFGYK